MTDFGRSVVLVLSGGNALGAFQAGAYEAIAARGIEPSRIAGASIGAINGAIVASLAPRDRLAGLRAFWHLAEQRAPLPALWPAGGEASLPGWTRTWRSAAAMQVLLRGRPGLFSPRLLWPWEILLGHGPHDSLYDTSMLPRTLERIIDFPRLHAKGVPLLVTAVDVETGEDVTFASERQRITAEHLRASAAFMPLFPPVEIEGRLLADAGLSANLPLLAVLEPGTEDRLCIAVDLAPRRGHRPRHLGDAAKRTLDLAFARQSAQAIHALRRAQEGAAARRGAITLIHVICADDEAESPAKMLDYSATSTEERWTKGRAVMSAALSELDGLSVRRDRSFTAYWHDGSGLRSYG
jgi:NTE family protein